MSHSTCSGQGQERSRENPEAYHQLNALDLERHRNDGPSLNAECQRMNEFLGIKCHTTFEIIINMVVTHSTETAMATELVYFLSESSELIWVNVYCHF